MTYKESFIKFMVDSGVLKFGEFTLKSGRLAPYFINAGAVHHMGDNLTGAGDGDDEQILVELPKLGNAYSKIVFVVNIYQAMQRKQHFGMIKNAFIRLVDAEKGVELCRYNLSENYDGKTAMIFGEIYLYNGEWKFNAIGEPTNDNGISELAARYQR